MSRAIAIAFCVLFLSPMAALADGKALYKSLGCAACHGKEGKKKSGMIPRIAGAPTAQLIANLTTYTNGGKVGKMSKMMTNNAKVKSLKGKTADIKAISDYLASVK